MMLLRGAAGRPRLLNRGPMFNRQVYQFQSVNFNSLSMIAAAPLDTDLCRDNVQSMNKASCNNTTSSQSHLLVVVKCASEVRGLQVSYRCSSILFDTTNSPLMRITRNGIFSEGTCSVLLLLSDRLLLTSILDVPTSIFPLQHLSSTASLLLPASLHTWLPHQHTFIHRYKKS